MIGLGWKEANAEVGELLNGKKILKNHIVKLPLHSSHHYSINVDVKKKLFARFNEKNVKKNVIHRTCIICTIYNRGNSSHCSQDPICPFVLKGKSRYCSNWAQDLFRRHFGYGYRFRINGFSTIVVNKLGARTDLKKFRQLLRAYIIWEGAK